MCKCKICVNFKREVIEKFNLSTRIIDKSVLCYDVMPGKAGFVYFKFNQNSPTLYVGVSLQHSVGIENTLKTYQSRRISKSFCLQKKRAFVSTDYLRFSSKSLRTHLQEVLANASQMWKTKEETLKNCEHSQFARENISDDDNADVSKFSRKESSDRPSFSSNYNSHHSHLTESSLTESSRSLSASRAGIKVVRASSHTVLEDSDSIQECTLAQLTAEPTNCQNMYPSYKEIKQRRLEMKIKYPELYQKIFAVRLTNEQINRCRQLNAEKIKKQMQPDFSWDYPEDDERQNKLWKKRFGNDQRAERMAETIQSIKDAYRLGKREVKEDQSGLLLNIYENKKCNYSRPKNVWLQNESITIK